MVLVGLIRVTEGYQGHHESRIDMHRGLVVWEVHWMHLEARTEVLLKPTHAEHIGGEGVLHEDIPPAAQNVRRVEHGLLLVRYISMLF